MALTISKHIEIKAGISIRRFLDEAKKIVDGQIQNHMTNKSVVIKANTTKKMQEITAKIFSPH